MLKIGLLTESEDDIAFYKAFLCKILKTEFGINEDIDFVTVKVGTHILKDIEKNSVFFFSKPMVSFAFYMSDYDNGQNCSQINDWIRQQRDAGKKYPIVCGHPKPHLEHWFCHEQDAIKKVFGLDGTNSLVCHPDPKAHIKSLIEAQDDDTKIHSSFYEEIGQHFYPDKLNHLTEYKRFKQSLRKVLHEIGVIIN